jgi:hypothetical protein
VPAQPELGSEEHRTADMDALPIREHNRFGHASRHAETMHACGHDGHTAMLLSAAQCLAAHRDFEGTVALSFQPAKAGRGGDGRRGAPRALSLFERRMGALASGICAARGARCDFVGEDLGHAHAGPGGQPAWTGGPTASRSNPGHALSVWAASMAYDRRDEHPRQAV